jgi:cell fate (sporulation/competence/biofilm development) regulator YlbF (YheA/YmcA/DUF963 family)
MNVYDAAHQLARALSQSIEYKDFSRAQEELKKDPESEKMIKDLRTKQWELYVLKTSGKPTEEAEKNLENLYNIINYNSTVRKYLEAEQRFATVMADIQQIISKAVGLDLDLSESANK